MTLADVTYFYWHTWHQKGDLLTCAPRNRWQLVGQDSDPPQVHIEDGRHSTAEVKPETETYPDQVTPAFQP